MLGDGCGTVGSVGAGGVARTAVATVVATAAVARSMATAAVARAVVARAVARAVASAAVATVVATAAVYGVPTINRGSARSGSAHDPLRCIRHIMCGGYGDSCGRCSNCRSAWCVHSLARSFGLWRLWLLWRWQIWRRIAHSA